MLRSLLLAWILFPSWAALVSPWHDSLSSASLLEGEHPNQQWYPKNLSVMLRCADCISVAGGRDYTVTEGTLLGATRGGFFLPWDSDGDIAFDLYGPDGKEDIAGYYYLYSRRNMKEHAEQCPMCKGVTLTHFMDNFKDCDGSDIYYWQTLDDILVGYVIELKTMHHRKVCESTRLKMTRRIFNDKPDSRIFPNPLPTSRDGPEYIDVEPFWIESEGSEKGKWRNLQVSVDKGSMYPFQRCNVVAALGENTSERVEVMCPSRPTAFLDVYYQGEWKEEPYNKYENGLWVKKPGGPSLKDYLASKVSYMTDAKAAAESPLAGPIPPEGHGVKFYPD